MSETRKPEPTGKPRTWRGLPVNSSVLMALLFAALIAAWMLSGEVIVGGSDEDKVPPIKSANAESSVQKKLFRVGARVFKSGTRDEMLRIRGRTEAENAVDIRAETTGRVDAISGRKGQFVNKGVVLCKLDEGSRQASLAGAQAQLEQAKSDYEAARKLSAQGYAADLNVNIKHAAFEAAAAALRQAEIDLANTAIRAPFDGIIEEQPARIGDFLTVGGACAQLVGLHPLLVVGEVSERDIGRITVGQAGRAELVTGEKAEGRIRFIASSAAAATRTFRVELEVANKDLSMRNGVTADVYIPLKPATGHHISPGLLTLNDNGDVGVRTLEAGGTVRFLPVQIIDQGKDGAFVAGLPDSVTIITSGQDYVVDGQKVEVTMEASERKAGSTAGGTHERT